MPKNQILLFEKKTLQSQESKKNILSIINNITSMFNILIDTICVELDRQFGKPV